MAQGREHEYDLQCQTECLALANLRGEVGTQKKMLEDLVHDLRGNGNPGFFREMANFQKEAHEFFTDHRAHEKDHEIHQNKRDQGIKDHLEATNRKQTIRLSIAGVIIAGLMLWLTYRDSMRKISISIPIPGISSSQGTAPQTVTSERISQ